jgi:Flp pilus assembly protein TadG
MRAAPLTRRNPASPSGDRRGLAATEFAVALPVVLMLVLGSIEVSNFIHLKQATTVAAYETALSATGTSATSAAAITRGNAVLTAFGVVGGTVTVSPTVTTTTTAGTDVTVTVTVPADSNQISPAWFVGGKTLTTVITMVRL